MERLLACFGLGYAESAAYLALLRGGSMSVTEAARASGMRRSSCQECLATLAEKGFANRFQERGRTRYQAEDPEAFGQIANERAFLVDRIIPLLGQPEEDEPWEVRRLGEGQAAKEVAKSRKKALPVVERRAQKSGLAIIGGGRTLVYGESAELPGAEIASARIAEFHLKLLGRAHGPQR